MCIDACISNSVFVVMIVRMYFEPYPVTHADPCCFQRDCFFLFYRHTHTCTQVKLFGLIKRLWILKIVLLIQCTLTQVVHS